MPLVLYKTVRNGEDVPPGWSLVRQLRGRGVYARYEKSDVVGLDAEVAAVVLSEKEANQLISRLCVAEENELINLLGLMKIGD